MQQTVKNIIEQVPSNAYFCKDLSAYFQCTGQMKWNLGRFNSAEFDTHTHPDRLYVCLRPKVHNKVCACVERERERDYNENQEKKKNY